MTWQLVETVSSSALNSPVIINHSFYNSLIVVEASCSDARPSWHEAGWLIQKRNISNIGLTKGNRKRIYLEKQEVRFDFLDLSPYTLEFVAKHWIPNITLKFWVQEELILKFEVNQPLMLSRLFGVGI